MDLKGGRHDLNEDIILANAWTEKLQLIVFLVVVPCGVVTA
jgi:hypothetical protein